MSPWTVFERGIRSLRNRIYREDCLTGHRVREAEACNGMGCDSVSVTELDRGEEATVSCLDRPGSADGRKLAAMGVLPGSSLCLLQRFPTYVLRVGRGELAVDRSLAALIRVRRE